LSSFKFEGISRGEADKVKEAISIMSGDIVTENLKMNSINIIKDHFFDKGFYNTEVEIVETKDTSTTRNDVTLLFKIKKGYKIKIKDVIVNGNKMISDNKVRSQMKDTKRYRWWRVWKSSRFAEKDF